MKYFDEAVNVTFTGISIVFAMLVLLVLVLMAFGFIMTAISKVGERKAEKHNKAELAKMTSDSASDNSSSEVSLHTTESCDNTEIVAVISAAVAMMYHNTNKKPVIKAIKKSGTRRTAWASAGLIDNTKSF